MAYLADYFWIVLAVGYFLYRLVVITREEMVKAKDKG